MAYLKDWAPRAFNDLELRLPRILPRARHGKGQAFCLDALEAAATLEADIAYIDPPYNQHSYLANYHIWETLVRWDTPAHYGVACKRVDVRVRGSVFNSRPGFAGAFAPGERYLSRPAVIRWTRRTSSPSSVGKRSRLPRRSAPRNRRPSRVASITARLKRPSR